MVEGVKAFEGMIRGFEVVLHTDHLNLLYNKLPNQRMTRWRLMLEEFHQKVVHVAGVDNKASDALSRLPMKRKAHDEIDWEEPMPRLRYEDEEDVEKENCFVMMTRVMSDNPFELGEFDDNEILYPVSTRSQSEFDDLYPLSIKKMLDDQLADKELIDKVQKALRKKHERYSYK